MVRERFKEAMSDMAETIRRVFTAPPARTVALGFPVPVSGQVPPVEVQALEPARGFAPVLRSEAGLGSGKACAEPMVWSARVQGEPGWAAWAAEATVCAPPLFRAEKCQRLEVPALPRRGQARRLHLEAMATRARSGWQGLAVPATRRLQGGWPAPACYAGLDRILALPVAITGEDLQQLSKALWMRYTLQLVRSTGQNIRNLEVLGLYRIPAKGTRQVRHDPVTGRLLVHLGPEAMGAKRAPFILARQKDDNSVVCCFVEET